MRKSAARKTSKITVTLWRPVWSRLEKKIEGACLNRDAYLSHLLDRELDYLEEEMPISNSEEARRFVNKQLRALINHDSTPLSIALAPAVAARIQRVCREKRIVRDALFNRIFLFLAFGPRLAGILLFKGLWMDSTSRKYEEWTNMVWREYKHDGPFFENVFEPFQAHQDPLWPVRACFQELELQDKPEYTSWIDPASGNAVAMAKWVPESLLHLPNRFYTVVLSDRDLLKSANSSARPASTRVAISEPKRGYHNLFGLNCYMPNFMVPGHADWKTAQAAVDDLLADL